eukprot:scaffold7337_cov66-Skeletonema_dohrnii-CCMP3373.AAC.6
MRSPQALLPTLVFIVLLPKAALGRQFPFYLYRAPPTNSPTSSPTCQPSAQPSSHPTGHPSYQPTTSVQPSSQQSSTSLRSSKSLVNSGNNFWTNAKGGSLVGFWMIMSLVGMFICCLRMKFVEKSQSVPEVTDDGAQNTQDKMIQDMMDDLDNLQFDFELPPPPPQNTKDDLVGMEIAPPQNSPVVPTASLFGFTLGV